MVLKYGFPLFLFWIIWLSINPVFSMDFNDRNNQLLANQKFIDFLPTNNNIQVPLYTEVEVLSFKNKKNETVYTIYLERLLMATAMLMGSGLIEYSLNSMNQNYLYGYIPYSTTYLALFWIQGTLFHINGPFKYQSYPFEQDTGFLLRSGKKEWMMNTGVSWMPSNGLLTTDAELFYNQFGLSSKIEFGQDWKRGSVDAVYHFARNDFFNFQLGVGYSYFNPDESGLNLQYGADMFYQPIHLFYHYDYTTNLQREIAQGYDIGLGIPINRYEIQLSYQSLLRTYSSQKEDGLKFGVKVWF